MGKPTGFLEIDRKTAPKRPVEARVHDFAEIDLPVPEPELRAQASRCMDCGVPFCHAGCPLGNLIPDFNDLVYRGRQDVALERLHATNNFPELTGRLCPAPCEPACVLALSDAPVTIKEIERAIANRGWEEGAIAPRPSATRTGKRVAIVGSGPAGLACAQQLARAGHDVIVFERSDRPGGLLRYGIPDFKLDRRVLDRRLDQLAAEGVVFRCGVDVGRGGAALLSDFDAVALGVGALQPRGLDVPGAELGGVHLALPYLEQENRVQAGDPIAVESRIHAGGKRVLILGGGDTGADCLGVAHRQGAASVVQLEICEMPPMRRSETDPWPLWPRIFRASPAHDEGGSREFALKTIRLEGEDHQGVQSVRRLVAARVRETAGGFEPIPGDDVVFEAELVLIATGYVSPEPSPLYAELGVELDRAGRIAADDAGRTNVPSVFAMGDARRGASLIVWAIAEGRKTAASVAAFLDGKRALKVVA